MSHQLTIDVLKLDYLKLKFHTSGLEEWTVLSDRDKLPKEEWNWSWSLTGCPWLNSWILNPIRFVRLVEHFFNICLAHIVTSSVNWKSESCWMLHNGCEWPSVLSHAAVSSCERPLSLQQGSAQIFRVKGLTVSGEKSDLKILVTQLQLPAHNNTKSERGTQTVTSAVSNALAPISREKNLRGWATDRKYTSNCMMCVWASVFVCLDACSQGIPLTVIWPNLIPSWSGSLCLPNPPLTPLVLCLVRWQ